MAPPAAAQTPVPAETAVLVAGPWQHRQVSANGARFHVAEAGSGPLILLLHGFPEFWWSWRHQLLDLPPAGFRVVAPDLRGYGASDKPPRGYDAYTLSADVAGLVRALGEREAVVVGSDWGGMLAWAVAECPDQAGDVGGQGVGVVPARWLVARAVPAQVGRYHSEAGGRKVPELMPP